MTDRLKRNANLVESLGSALRLGRSGLGTAPNLLRKVLVEDAWREFVTELGATVTPDSFEEFVVTPPLQGLGADMGLVRRIVADDPMLVDLLDRAVQRPVGRPATGSNRTSSKVAGTTKDQALRRLRKDRPDLHERVIAGELSPHAAAVEAGFRKRTVTVPLEPVAAARTLRRHLSEDDCAQLRDLLTTPATAEVPR